jgi:hypothetical protein
MTLQQLIAELQTLAQAYPPDTTPVQIVVWAHSVICEVTTIKAVSADTGVTINIEAD